MSDKRTIVLSGVKPTGRPHIGNYFGAIRQFVEMQDTHDSYVFIANYHALTTLQNAREMRENSLSIALDYLAVGLNPEKTVLFKQSDVPQVCELAWIFNCITTMPYLARAHAYKDALAKNKELSVGTFDYPMLMTADILIHDADIVPVGQDQKQHVEFARDTALKFNRLFASEIFKLPAPLIVSDVQAVKGIDGQKMSKSYRNTIPLFATRDELEKLVMGIVTDSEADIPENVHALHTLFRTESELKDIYETNKGKYKALKEALLEDIDAFIAPLREKRALLEKDIDSVRAVLEQGGKRARMRAEEKMEEVRQIIGIR